MTSDTAWLFSAEEIENSPSRADGVDAQSEGRTVARMADFLRDASRLLRLPMLTTAVAVKYWQRFYMLESLKRHNPWEVAGACLFLACKVQETHMRLREVIYATVKVRTRGSEDFPDGEEVRESHPHYFAEKEKLLIKERVLLRVLHFDLTVDHAYKHVWAMTKTFIPASHMQGKVTQVAWNFINDSLRTYMHVQYCEREIAASVFYLSANYCDVPLPDGRGRDAAGRRLISWHELFPVNLARVHSIGERMLDEYDPSMAKRAGADANGASGDGERHGYRS
ncbi:hypothetical protein BU14_0280s0025 [Porphyra umbilicalis]|uniref:Cyclin-like domain-containing protein n=1 Tax=Porphyra umbilicalis TaxID=2786 RepID=A0A1X6P163_PORUM|nr:hypothetical protein BU14_0280s0025 [Porphyra umbilicalis]|eukprot:OSX74609.1 hypothetical protein BU14_0280s0025 [Porphyra umbilicalis]